MSPLEARSSPLQPRRCARLPRPPGLRPGPQAFTHADPSATALPLIPCRHWPACETRRRGHFLGVLCAGSSQVNSPASTSCTFTAPSQSLPAGSLEQRGAPPTDGLASPASCLRAQSHLYPSSPARWALAWELGRAPYGEQDKQVSGMEDGHSKQRTRTSQTAVSAESEEGGGPGQEPGEPSCVLSHLPPALSFRCRGAWLNLPEPSSVLSSPSLYHSRGAALSTSQRAFASVTSFTGFSHQPMGPAGVVLYPFYR